MKKMLTLLSAGAMFAASAATLSTTSGTTFAGLTAGDAFSASGAAAEGGKYYWYSADAQSGTNMSLAANYYGGACGRPNQFAEAETSIALAVDAENILYRAAEGSASAFSSPSFTQVDLGDGGLYIDTLIKFEQCRDEADIADDAGKLAVWLNSASNLVITAGKYSGETFGTNDYVAAGLGEVQCGAFNPDAWYRLTVKAANSNGKVLFNVYIDGQLVTALDGGPITFFPSLQPSSLTLSALAFQGEGAVDDISFTEELPNFLFVGVAQIGDTYYETLADALAAVNYGQTIVLLADPGVDSVTLPKTGIALSDPNGYLSTVTGPNGQEVTASGNIYTLPLTAVNPVTGETEDYTWSFVGTDTWNGTGYWRNSSGANPSGTPAKSGENTWDPILFDGSNININASMSVEGWNLRMGLYNGATVTMNTFVKYQGDTTMWMTVDDKSQLTVGGFGGGNVTDGQVIKLSVAKANGITWNVDLTSVNANNTFEYYLKGAGSVAYQAVSAANHKIKMADVTLSGNEKSVQSKTLVSFTSSTPTFTADAAIKVKNTSDEVVKTVTLDAVNSTGTTTLTTDNAVGTCELVQTTTGIVLFWVDGDPSDIREYKPSININFTDGTPLSTSADVGLGDYSVPGTSWNNLIGNNGSLAALNAVDTSGETSATTASVTITDARGYYQCSSLSAASDLRQGYIDESSTGLTPAVTVSGIPYDKYRVVVYTATDAASVKFGYITVNGKNYTYDAEGTLTEGTAAWGASGAQDTAEPLAEGTNVLVSAVTIGSTLTVVGHRSGNNPRGCIAAIQIVEVKPEAGENDLIIEVSGPTTYTVSEARTLSGTVYVIGNGTLTLEGSTKITAGTIDVAGNVVFNVNTDRLDAPTFTGSGTVVYDGACPVTGKGWTDSDNWRGTVWVKNISNLVGTSFPMNDYGNSSSTLKVSMLKGWINTATTDTDVAPALELDGDCEYALWLSNGNGYNSNNGSRTQIRELKGSGLLKGSDSGPQALLLVKKWDDFSGSIELNNKVVVFGTSLPTQATISGGGYIVVNSGASVEIPSGKTWSVSNGFIVNGTLAATGNMAATTGSTSTSLVRGSGTVVFDGKLPSPTGDAWWKNANWTGTVQMSSVTFSSTNNGNFNDYGNSTSTLKLNNCGGYFKNSYTLVPALEIGGVYTWLDGYSGTGNAFKVSTLKGSGTIWAKNASRGADKAVLQVTSDWSGFTGVINMGSVAGDGRMVVAFGSTLPETIYAGEIYIAPDAIVENKSSSAWWSTGKGFVVDGTFKATGRDKWGGGTAMTLDDTGVLELTSTANAQDYADYSGVTGTGTIKYSSTGGWRTFPSDDAKMPATTLTVQVELADSLIITKNNNGETVIGNLAGSKNIRSDWSATSGGADARTLTVTQSKDTEWQGKFVSNRITQFNVAGTGGTLTLSGTQDATIPANITGSVNLTGTWVGATTVNGTIGGTGTLTGNLTFGAGSTFKAFASDADGLSVSGSIAYPASGTVTVDVGALGASAKKVVLLTAASESDIDLSKFALADGTNRKYKLAKEGATLVLKGARKGVIISVY